MTGLIESRQIETASDAADGDRWAAHSHSEHELLWANTDRVTVVTPSAVHLVPRGTSVWIPAGVMHEVHAPPGNTMRCTWFQTARPSERLARSAVLMTPSMLGLVLEHMMTSQLDATEREHAEMFALDILSRSAELTVDVPRPRSRAFANVASSLVADPADSRSVEEWAASCALSVRSFSRRFAAETGMPFSQWRAALRHRTAMQLLASGTSVRATAASVGFDSTPSFTTAFRKHTGMTPAAFARSVDPLREWPI